MIDFQLVIGGEAGYGIMTTGVMLSKIATRLGLSVFDYVEYPSLIRGGHNAYILPFTAQRCRREEDDQKHLPEEHSFLRLLYQG